ncbi:hypothetical protein GTO89_13050 [Heliobacterium gestii]|uniref:Uncharacterized protein n=1 Tax=Heliomicrobium gestii TaxID=2699 RepID=A0A845LH99_HELGE|nr:hypothetical protein [Heliomicrobium gestii]MBM7867493.1 hypothetical protein [Heliomicrobium gestii]MZP43959.1 hypothetical protein [Heliomicrobium gestii]
MTKSQAFGMLIVIAICIYTVNYGRWLQQRGYTGAAWSSYLLAAVAFLAPLVYIWMRAMRD